MSKNGKVVVTGRKGLGKLSAFGVATEMEVRFVQNGNAVCLRLNYDDLRAWPEKHGATNPYEPTLVANRSGATTDKNGGEVRLRKLHRTRAINDDEIRKGLARRLAFAGKKFEVLVNGKGIQPGDRVRKDDCDPSYVWDVSQIPNGDTLATKDKVTGWIGFLPESSQTDRGVDIFANQKAAELGSFFSFSSTHAQYARAYLVGEINADFLDMGDDLVATARNSVVWESPQGLALQEWGQQTVRWALDQWVELKKKEKEKKLFSTTDFENWLKTRTASEQRVAHRIAKILIDDPKIEPASAAPLLDIVKNSVETVAFRELVETIEAGGVNVGALLQLFDEWRVIEAREHLKLADGRISVIEQLYEFMDSGALEVQQMQPLFENNPWLIEQAWSEVEGQTTYTKLLREKCTEPTDYEDVDRRIDILGIRDGGVLTIVEIKKPKKVLSRRDLEQIEKYVDWARSQFTGTGKDAPRYVNGLLVVGELSKLADIKAKQQRLAGDDIRVERYVDLHDRAKEYYGQVERILEKVAPEYARKKRKASKKQK